jgi:hypothetical protein
MMIRLISYFYIFVLLIFAVGWGHAYRMIYSEEISKIFNYSSGDPHKVWSRPKNIKDLCKMEKEGTLLDPIVRKWVLKYIRYKRLTIIWSIPFFIIFILAIILLSQI